MKHIENENDIITQISINDFQFITEVKLTDGGGNPLDYNGQQMAILNKTGKLGGIIQFQ